MIRPIIERVKLTMQTITPQQIQQIVPKTPFNDAVTVAFWLKYAALRGVTTVRQTAAFIANAAFETRGFGNIGGLTTAITAKWKRTNCNALADANDFRAICRAFDKNLSGYGARKLIYKQALRVLSASPTPVGRMQ